MTGRQERFVAEYVKSLNGTKAAIAAGYSSRTARVQAARLLTKADVCQLVEAVQQKALDEAQVTVERVIKEYAAIAFLDPITLFDDTGRLLPLAAMPESTRRALAAFETEPDVVETTPAAADAGAPTRVRFISKLVALHALAKHLGMFAEKPLASGPSGLNIHICRYGEDHECEDSPRNPALPIR